VKLTQNKYGSPSFEVDEVDIQNSIEIEKVMQMKGWQILKDLEKEAREYMIQSGKDCAKTSERKELSVSRWAYLDGFDKCRILADDFVRQVKILIEQNNKENEE
jgi:hypothetical protein